MTYPKPTPTLGGVYGLDRIATEAAALCQQLTTTHRLTRPEVGATRPPATDTNARGDAWRAYDISNAADALADLHRMEQGSGLGTLTDQAVTSFDRILRTLRTRETAR